jgi:hypothetical protein
MTLDFSSKLWVPEESGTYNTPLPTNAYEDVNINIETSLNAEETELLIYC